MYNMEIWTEDGNVGRVDRYEIHIDMCMKIKFCIFFIFIL